MKVGDQVKLKSGGPTMTVAIVYADGDVKCVFWNGHVNKFEELLVAAGALRPD